MGEDLLKQYGGTLNNSLTELIQHGDILDN